jgi:phosphohistidine swiveling domain-containing protein
MVKPDYNSLRALIGGKGYSLTILNQVANVPSFSIADHSLFYEFCVSTGLEETLAYYWKLAMLQEQLPLDNARDTIIRHFLHYPMPENLQINLERIFNSVPGATKIARSSAVVEDGQDHSWAGMFYSVIGIESFEEWLVAVRLCWAAVATARVSNYARKLISESRLPSISVILQQAIDSAISGIVFSTNPTQSDSFPILEATWGQGMPLVSGIVTPERWTFNNNSPKLIQRIGRGLVFLLRSSRACRPGELERISLPNGQSLLLRSVGTFDDDGYWRGVPISNKEISSVISEDIAKEIFSFCLERQNHRGAVELEWSIDGHGKIWWLQERPITSLSCQSSLNIEYDESRELFETSALIRGVTGSRGSANGLGWYPEGGINTENLVDSRILFQKYTTPDDVPNIVAASAVVTQDGGLLSHTAIVCREIGIPCIVGANPFPPNVDVNAYLHVNADLGFVKCYSDHTISTPHIHPLPIIKDSPQKYQYEELLRWWCPQDLIERIPRVVVQHLQATACVPGILGPLEVLPDVRLSQPKLGFPIGITFRSERIHPTSVGDCGDGFLVAEVKGVSKHQLLTRITDLVSLILTSATTPNTKWNESIFGKRPSLDEIGEDGLLSLQNNSYLTELISKVQFSGRVQSGCFRDLPIRLREKADSYLLWTGESGHFLELLSDSSSNDLSDGRVFLFLHTGSADIGLEFLRYAVRVGASRSAIEGLDSPDLIAKGLWGLDVTSVLGSTLAANMLALTNYGFVRRVTLFLLINSIFQQLFGEAASLQLVFDTPHSFIRVDGDAVVHSQGVQHIEPGNEVSFILTGAPGVSSYVCHCDKNLDRRLISHGKVNFGYNPNLLRPDFSQKVAKSCILIGSNATHDVAIADAQAREAAIIAQNQLPQSRLKELFPLLCIRGVLNGQRKIV